MASTRGWSAEKLVKKCDVFLILVDESSSMHLAGDEASKIKEAKEFLREINKLIPSADYKGALAGYNHNDNFEDILGYKVYVPLEKYSRKAFAKGIEKVHATICSSSLAYGIDVASKILSGSTGKIHILILSDGMDTKLYHKSVKEAVSDLKNAVKGTPCIYAVQFGDSDEGSENLEAAVKYAGCGKVLSYSEAMEKKKSLVREVFGYTTATRTPTKDTDGDGVPDNIDKCPNTPKGAKVDSRGCWQIGMVHFGIDSYEIKPEYIPVLEEVLEVLKENPELKIEVIGHTDALGDEAHNSNLSLERAQEVKKWLCSHGVSCDRIIAKGMGSRSPIADNSTPEGRAKNRRVEFKIIR
ncbi:MAG: OmpA family protein [Deferribacteres bacterium]|nr:OmpA family protein [Deferribacteres bacterium]